MLVVYSYYIFKLLLRNSNYYWCRWNYSRPHSNSTRNKYSFLRGNAGRTVYLKLHYYSKGILERSTGVWSKWISKVTRLLATCKLGPIAHKTNRCSKRLFSSRKLPSISLIRSNILTSVRKRPSSRLNRLLGRLINWRHYTKIRTRVVMEF